MPRAMPLPRGVVLRAADVNGALQSLWSRVLTRFQQMPSRHPAAVGSAAIGMAGVAVVLALAKVRSRASTFQVARDFEVARGTTEAVE